MEYLLNIKYSLLNPLRHIAVTDPTIGFNMFPMEGRKFYSFITMQNTQNFTWDNSCNNYVYE